MLPAIDDILLIGTYDNQWYISTVDWMDFPNMMRVYPEWLTWLCSNGWYFDNEHKELWLQLNERYNLESFYPGEYIYTKEFE